MWRANIGVTGTNRLTDALACGPGAAQIRAFAAILASGSWLDIALGIIHHFTMFASEQ